MVFCYHEVPTSLRMCGICNILAHCVRVHSISVTCNVLAWCVRQRQDAFASHIVTLERGERVS